MTGYEPVAAPLLPALLGPSFAGPEPRVRCGSGPAAALLREERGECSRRESNPQCLAAPTFEIGVSTSCTTRTRDGWGARVRTEALRLKRPLLYQLSYTPRPWRCDKGLNSASRGLESRHRPSGHSKTISFSWLIKPLSRTGSMFRAPRRETRLVSEALAEQTAVSEEGLEPPSAGPKPAVLANWTIPTRSSPLGRERSGRPSPVPRILGGSPRTSNG